MFAELVRAVRRLAHRPSLVVSISGILSLAMGASIAIFGVIDRVLLRPIDVRSPDDIVVFQKTVRINHVLQPRRNLSWLDVQTVQGLGLVDAAATTTSSDNLSKRLAIEVAGRADYVPGRFVTWNYFQVLGVDLALGRDFTRLDDAPDAAPVVILAYEYWRRALADRDEALGTQIRVNGIDATIVGVLAPSFGAGTEVGVAMPSVFLPVHAAPAVGRTSLAAGDIASSESSTVRPATWFHLIARAPGNRAQVQADLQAALMSDRWTAVSLVDTLLPFESGDDLRRFLQLLALAVGLTLIVASVNAAVLLYGDVQERATDFKTRAALGASPSRLAWGLAVELMALATVTGVCAVIVATAVWTAIASFDLPGGVSIEEIQVSQTRAGLFGALLCAGTMVLVGVGPMWSVAKQGLRPRARGETSQSGMRTLKVMSAIQAAACVLMTVAALAFVRSMLTAMRADLGFDTTGLLSVDVGLPPEMREGYKNIAHIDAFLDELRRVPGVESVTVGPVPLLRGGELTTTELLIDRQAVALEQPIDLAYVSNDYFRTVRYIDFRGRDFETADTYESARVAVVNEAAAKLLWPHTNPLGRSVARSAPNGRLARENAVVGVVPNIVVRSIGEPPRPIIYLSRTQHRDWLAGFTVGTGAASILVRSSRPAADIVPILSAHAQRSGIVVLSTSGVEERREAMLMPQRLGRAVLLFLSAMAVVIALTGTYAAAHLAVVRDHRDNGVRLALGAQPAALVRGVLVRTSLYIGTGAVFGGMVAWCVGPFLRRFTLGLVTTQLWPIVLVSVAVTVVAVFAAYVPNRRVFGIDPARLLRD